MQLLLARHLWGMVGTSHELFSRIQSAGYQAVEAVLPAAEEQEQWKALLSTYRFPYIAQIYTQGTSVEEHISSFRQQVEQAMVFHPMMINCHSGSDLWDLEACQQYLREALAIEQDAGIPVAHETHRSRILFHPLLARPLLQQFEELHICCDFSHWVCVCERLLDDQQELLQLCADRCIHIHARVGYEEGPQVPDPQAPEYQGYVEAHERWWDLIWAAQERRNMPITTLTPEFGPPAYLHCLPYTQAPVASLEDICNWQAQRQRERFAARKNRDHWQHF